MSCEIISHYLSIISPCFCFPVRNTTGLSPLSQDTALGKAHPQLTPGRSDPADPAPGGTPARPAVLTGCDNNGSSGNKPNIIPKNVGGSETCRQGWKHSRDIRFGDITEANRSTWSPSFFIPFSPKWKEMLLGLKLASHSLWSYQERPGQQDNDILKKS